MAKASLEPNLIGYQDGDLCPEERKVESSSSEHNENQDSMSSSNDLLDAQQELNLSDDNLVKLHKILKENVSV